MKPENPPWSPGDWAQAACEIHETLPDGTPVCLIAATGAVGHVWAVDGEWLTVTFERTGMSSDCHVSELVRLGGAQTGTAL